MKEIKNVYKKYGKKALKDCKEMSIEEEKKYIEEYEPKMKEELNKLYKEMEKELKNIKIKYGKNTLSNNSNKPHIGNLKKSIKLKHEK